MGDLPTINPSFVMESTRPDVPIEEGYQDVNSMPMTPVAEEESEYHSKPENEEPDWMRDDSLTESDKNVAKEKTPRSIPKAGKTLNKIKKRSLQRPTNVDSDSEGPSIRKLTKKTRSVGDAMVKVPTEQCSRCL
jgi:hypothetical protein